MNSQYLEVLVVDATLFLAVFGKPLADFYDGIFGFDIVKFDEWLKVPDGTSTKSFVLTKYGQEAVELILRLLHSEETQTSQ